ncbi:hypothetical protein BC834DRAFT_699428 [Gloeopeniophorella convolvens]|nr:hypothetical protein BC834DRAFT_699428 [Gloeopeniophorella convolvens]
MKPLFGFPGVESMGHLTWTRDVGHCAFIPSRYGISLLRCIVSPIEYVAMVQHEQMRWPPYTGSDGYFPRSTATTARFIPYAIQIRCCSAPFLFNQRTIILSSTSLVRPASDTSGSSAAVSLSVPRRGALCTVYMLSRLRDRVTRYSHAYDCATIYASRQDIRHRR